MYDLSSHTLYSEHLMDILCTTTTTQRVVWFILVYRPPLTMCLPSTNHTTLKRGESAICVFGIRGMFIDLSSDCCIMRPRGLVPDGVPQGAAFGHSRRSCCVMACDGQSTPRRTNVRWAGLVRWFFMHAVPCMDATSLPSCHDDTDTG